MGIYILTEIETPLYDYCSSYEAMSEEIHEGIAEGFNEGLREGIKQGFIAGIKECRASGFSNIDVKGMEEILENSFKTASEKTIQITFRQVVGKEYRKNVSPSFKKKMEEACNKAVEEIKNSDCELEKASALKLMYRMDVSIEKIRECIGNVCGSVKEQFSTNIVFESLFDSMQDEFKKGLDKNLEACEDRVCKAIDIKIDNKNRVDASIEKLKDYIGNACGGIKKTLPADVIFKNFFDCLQDEFNKDLNENLKTCEKRICKTIDGKTKDKKVDHE